MQVELARQPCGALDEHSGGLCGNCEWTTELCLVEGDLASLTMPLCCWHRWVARQAGLTVTVVGGEA